MIEKNQAALETEDSVKLGGYLYMAIELSRKKWKLGFSDGKAGQPRVVTMEARDLQRLTEEIEKAQKRFRLGPEMRVRSCYEAGREGVWVHRALTGKGIENVGGGASS